MTPDLVRSPGPVTVGLSILFSQSVKWKCKLPDDITHILGPSHTKSNQVNVRSTLSNRFAIDNAPIITKLSPYKRIHISGLWVLCSDTSARNIKQHTGFKNVWFYKDIEKGPQVLQIKIALRRLFYQSKSFCREQMQVELLRYGKSFKHLPLTGFSWLQGFCFFLVFFQRPLSFYIMISKDGCVAICSLQNCGQDIFTNPLRYHQ